MTREERARQIVDAAECEYRDWERVHPQATTLEKLYRIYDDGNRILRNVANGRRMPLWLAWLVGGLAGVVGAQLWGVPGIAVAAVGVGIVVYVIEWRRYDHA